jgi:hypothetical protein
MTSSLIPVCGFVQDTGERITNDGQFIHVFTTASMIKDKLNMLLDPAQFQKICTLIKLYTLTNAGECSSSIIKDVTGIRDDAELMTFVLDGQVLTSALTAPHLVTVYIIRTGFDGRVLWVKYISNRVDK